MAQNCYKLLWRNDLERMIAFKGSVKWVLSHTAVITSGPLSYSSDYFWSSLIQ